jgi:hypothetical protein
VITFRNMGENTGRPKCEVHHAHVSIFVLLLPLALYKNDPQLFFVPPCNFIFYIFVGTIFLFNFTFALPVSVLCTFRGTPPPPLFLYDTKHFLYFACYSAVVNIIRPSCIRVCAPALPIPIIPHYIIDYTYIYIHYTRNVYTVPVL